MLAFSPCSVMSHYIWVPQIIGDISWNIEHFYVKKNALYVTTECPLVVVTSPLVAARNFEFKYRRREDQNEFYITEYKEKENEQVLEGVKRTLSYAIDRGAQIIFFPEMLGFPGLVEKIQDFIVENSNGKLAIVCLPSMEVPINDGKENYQNMLTILDGEGEIITQYRKQHPFSAEQRVSGADEPEERQRYFEPICADHKLKILHIEGVGRVGILICADAFCDELKSVRECLRLNLLLAPSYSPGVDAFFHEFYSSRARYCDTIWCNTCAAHGSRTSKKEIVAYFPGGHEATSPITHHTKYCCTGSQEQCNSCSIEISIAANYNGVGEVHHEKYKI